MKRALKNLGKRGLFHVFGVGQRLGVDVLPRHFYSQIPDLRALRQSEDWKRPRSMQSIAGSDIGSQLSFAEDVCRPDFIRAAEDGDVYASACRRNGEPGFGPIEAEFLYSFIRAQRPSRIIQVGAGVSSAVILAAAQHAGYQPSVTCIDPFPTQFLSEAGATGAIELVKSHARLVAGELCSKLRSGDFFFVDSTHAVMPGSEVNTIILDVLPNLGAGVWVHFHDITFPYDYPRMLLDGTLFFSNESTLLHAFLSSNQRYKLCASLSMLHYAVPDQLRQLIPSYRPAGQDHGLQTRGGHFPSSTYLRAI